MPQGEDAFDGLTAVLGEALDETVRSQTVEVEKVLKEAQIPYEIPPSDVVGVGFAIVDFEGHSVQIQWSAHLPHPEVHFLFDAGELPEGPAEQNDLLKQMLQFTLELAVVSGARFGLKAEGAPSHSSSRFLWPR